MRKLLIVAACAALALGVLSGCSGDQTSAPAQNQSALESRQAKTSQGDVYYAGVYKVGTDLPAGSYVLTEDENDGRSDAYVAVYTDGTMDDYVYGENFKNNWQVNVTDGQVLEVKRATFVAA